MDLLTHLFLPITVAYVIRPELFPSPWYLGVAVFAVLPDVDKLLGAPGALHSVVTLGLVGSVFLAGERWYRGQTALAGLAIALLFSHLALDFLDGGPVPFLYPFVDVGVGLQYPTEIVFGGNGGAIGISEPLPTLHVTEPDPTRSTYPLLSGYGLLSGLTFLVIYGASVSDRASIGRSSD